MFRIFCLADFNSLAGSWNISNVNYISHPEGGIRSKCKTNLLAGSRNFRTMNGILRPEVENFSQAVSIESSVWNIILSTTVELCLPT